VLLDLFGDSIVLWRGLATAQHITWVDMRDFDDSSSGDYALVLTSLPGSFKLAVIPFTPFG
jgi:hypothetical protein